MANFEKTHIPKFRRFVIQNFPFIEEDFDALTDYGLISKVVEYLNQVIESTNESSGQVENLTDLYNQLKNYVDNYFENLNVQEEINRKLDLMAENGTLGQYFERYVTPELDVINTRITTNVNNLQTQIDSLASGSPLVASSTSGMTDTSRVYVNTTDGNWYYYNGTTWVAGGTYQSTGLGSNTVTFDSLNPEVANKIWGFSTDVSTLGSLKQNRGITTFNYTTPMLIKKGTIITVSSDFVTNYKWNLKEMTTQGTMIGSNIFTMTTDTSVTMPRDAYCTFAWMPIDGTWETETYTVDRDHYINSDDITSIAYFYPKTEQNYLIDLDINKMHNMMIGCTTEANATDWIGTSTRVSMPYIWKSKYDIQLVLRGEYDYAYVTWDGAGEDAAKLSNTGWTRNELTIPANTYFTLSFRKSDNASTTTWTEDPKTIFNLISIASMNYAKDYIDSRLIGVSDYNYEGQDLDLQIKHGYSSAVLYPHTAYAASSQGFDIYNSQYVVQAYNGGILEIMSYTSGEQLTAFNGLGFSHGGSVQVSNTFYDENDLLPLVYVSTCTYPAKVYILRVQNTSTCTVQEILDLGTDAGYWSIQCCDFDNNILYSFGYPINEYRDPTNNSTVCCQYDLNNRTQVGTNEYELNLIKREEKEFIYCVQACNFLNGNIYIISSYLPNEQPSWLYVFNPEQNKIIAIFKNMPSGVGNVEIEGIGFAKNSAGTMYDFVIASRASFTKLMFT